MPRPRKLSRPATKMEILTALCSLMCGRPAAVVVANHRLCTECATNLETIAADAGIEYVAGYKLQ